MQRGSKGKPPATNPAAAPVTAAPPPLLSSSSRAGQAAAAAAAVGPGGRIGGGGEGGGGGDCAGPYRNTLDGLRTVYRRAGAAGLFKGSGARIAFYTPSTMISMSLYDELKKTYHHALGGD